MKIIGILIDLGIILIIALSTFIGYKQGLIKVAIKILAFFIAMIVAITLYKPVSKLVINNTNIDESIQNAISSKILPEGVNPDQEVQIEDNIPDIIMKSAGNTVNSISQSIAIQIIEMATLLILFFSIKIVIRFISALSNIITKVPIIKQFNELRWYLIWIVKRDNHDLCCISNTYAYISDAKHRLFRFNR